MLTIFPSGRSFVRPVEISLDIIWTTASFSCFVHVWFCPRSYHSTILITTLPEIYLRILNEILMYKISLYFGSEELLFAFFFRLPFDIFFHFLFFHSLLFVTYLINLPHGLTGCHHAVNQLKFFIFFADSPALKAPDLWWAYKYEKKLKIKQTHRHFCTPEMTIIPAMRLSFARSYQPCKD